MMESMAAALEDRGRAGDSAGATAAAGRRQFPVDLVIASAGRSEAAERRGRPTGEEGVRSGMFIYADADMKFDQPQTEVVFDRDKLRSQGVDLSQAGRDLSTLIGANYVNRFSIHGRSYKVIPQVERAERLTPDQLEHIYITGSHDRLVPLSTFATPENHDGAAGSEEVPAAQRRSHPRRNSTARASGAGARISRSRGEQDSAAGRDDRLCGRIATAPHRGRKVPRPRFCCRPC